MFFLYVTSVISFFKKILTIRTDEFPLVLQNRVTNGSDQSEAEFRRLQD